MQKTKISYLTHTYNPLAMRCTPVSEGCQHCWHRRFATRHAANPRLSTEARAAYAGETEPVLIQSRLDEPLRLRKPAVIGVQFSGDLFHEDVSYYDQEAVLDALFYCPEQTFVLLTKRPESAALVVPRFLKHASNMKVAQVVSLPDNCWIGVSVEDQAAADERIPLLLQIPAAHHWLSYEPAISGIDITDALHGYPEHVGDVYRVTREMARDAGDLRLEGEPYGEEQWEQTMPALEFVAAGAETGPHARPAHPQWFRDVRDQCQKADVPFMLKSLGEWGIHEPGQRSGNLPWGTMDRNGTWWSVTTPWKGDLDSGKEIPMVRFGKNRVGHLLDGREHMETPWSIQQPYAACKVRGTIEGL